MVRPTLEMRMLSLYCSPQVTVTVALPFCHFRLKGQKPKPHKYPNNLNTLGDHIRKRRLELGLLQREVAERIGAAETTICNWERQRTAPTLSSIPKVLQFLAYVPLNPILKTLVRNSSLSVGSVALPKRRLPTNWELIRVP